MSTSPCRTPISSSTRRSVRIRSDRDRDVYELVVERHLKASTIVTSNREPAEWIDVMADRLLAQSAIDRLQSAAYVLVVLVVEGESFRKRQKPGRKP